MAPFDPFNDPPNVMTAHDRLIAALDKKNNPTTQDLEEEPGTGILSCPTEILVGIFEYLSDRHDVAQICKVNKRFFATALPKLYRELHIRVGSKMDPALLQMLTLENAGLRFVRAVQAFPGDDWQVNTALAHQSLVIVINHLPQNRLAYFRWNGHDPLSSALVACLWSRQNYLKSIEILPDWKEDDRLILGDVALAETIRLVKFPRLREVIAKLSDVESARAASMALQCGSVNMLRVDGRSWSGGVAREGKPDTNPDPMIDEGDAGSLTSSEFRVIDPLTEKLFSHLNRAPVGHAPQFKNLMCLVLQDLDLSYSKYTWFTYLELHDLKHLYVRYCGGADIFLLRLSDSFPTLQTFEVVHWITTPADQILHAIEEILRCSPRRLKYLDLCLRNATRLPSAKLIEQHGDSLIRLLVDVSRTKAPELPFPPELPLAPSPPPKHISICYELGEFTQLMKACKSLRELGIALPRVNLNYNQLIQSGGECHNFRSYLDVIACNLRLSTLTMVNWPKNYISGQTDGYYAARNLSLARLAVVIFWVHRRHNKDRRLALEIVTFGVDDDTGDQPKPVYFLESEVSVLGKKSKHAKEVELETLHKHALDTEILDYDVRNFNKPSRKGMSAVRFGSESEDEDEEVE